MVGALRSFCCLANLSSSSMLCFVVYHLNLFIVVYTLLTSFSFHVICSSFVVF
jgi:hypothetical protein